LIIQIIVLGDGRNQESIIKINSSCPKTNYANFLLLKKIDNISLVESEIL